MEMITVDALRFVRNVVELSPIGEIDVHLFYASNIELEDGCVFSLSSSAVSQRNLRPSIAILASSFTSLHHTSIIGPVLSSLNGPLELHDCTVTN
jgi:hypothetical protein